MADTNTEITHVLIKLIEIKNCMAESNETLAFDKLCDLIEQITENTVK